MIFKWQYHCLEESGAEIKRMHMSYGTPNLHHEPLADFRADIGKMVLFNPPLHEVAKFRKMIHKV